MVVDLVYAEVWVFVVGWGSGGGEDAGPLILI